MRATPFDFRIVIEADSEAGSSSIEAHRFILQMRSDVFRAMLSNSESVESRTGQLVVKDLPFSVMDTLVEAMYDPYFTHDHLEDYGSRPVDDLCALLTAADKYNFPKMVAACGQKLAEMLSPKTAPLILSASEMHKCGNLLEVALDYFKRNKEAVKATQEWAQMIRDCNADLLRILVTLN